jgi:hypothetical protein
MSALHLDTQFLKAEIAKLIDANPELAEDETLLEDMLVGETAIEPVLAKLVRKANEAKATAAATKELASAYSERSQRFTRQADAARALMKSVMDAAGLQKITLPEATLSITKPRASVNILDLQALPQGYFQTERKADRAAIKSAIGSGEHIPGAELLMGEEALTVRIR